VEVEVADDAAVDAAPRLRSYCSMSARARGFGAPERVPAGKVDTSTS
jgi:hypothetical protein